MSAGELHSECMALKADLLSNTVVGQSRRFDASFPADLFGKNFIGIYETSSHVAQCETFVATW